MVTVALAGATTGFGLTMLRAFVHLNTLSNTPHDIILLSRSVQPEWTTKGVDVRPVSYTSHSELVHALRGVHTLLSLIGGSSDALRDAQLALIPAAIEAGVTRFAPSEYAGNGPDGIDLYAPKAQVWRALAQHADRLQSTRFSCGLFMSVLATGTPKPVTAVGAREGLHTGEEEALAGLRPWNFIFNMKGGTADLPGDGRTPLTWTDMRDVATFVYRSLSLPSWPRELGMRGSVYSCRDVIAIIENVQRRKFLVKENSIEDLRTEADRDVGKRFYNQVRVRIAEGWALVPEDLNNMFPDLRPTTCEEFVERWWAGEEAEEASWGESKTFGGPQ